jgi:hypothetical protein
MRSEVVEFVCPEWTAHLTVSEATVLIGMRRTRLRLDGERAIEPDDDRRLLRVYSYPDVCSAVSASDGLPFSWPPDFETFLKLPDGLLVKLEEAIYRLNPHWLPGGAPVADPKAPPPASTNGSRTGRRRKTKTASSSPT